MQARMRIVASKTRVRRVMTMAVVVVRGKYVRSAGERGKWIWLLFLMLRSRWRIFEAKLDYRL